MNNIDSNEYFFCRMEFQIIRVFFHIYITLNGKDVRNAKLQRNILSNLKLVCIDSKFCSPKMQE